MTGSTDFTRGEYVYGGALSVGGALVRLKANGGSVAAEQVYFERGLPNGSGGAVIVGEHIYGTDTKRTLVAADFATGKVSWKADDFGMGSVAYADGRLYLHLTSGELVLVEATPEGFRQQGKFMPPAQPKRKQAGQYPESAFTHPVIANGRLYLRDLTTMWVYDIKGSN